MSGSAATLPPLRSTVAWMESGYDATGAPGLLLHDPIRHRYFRLAGRARKILDNWLPDDPTKVAARADCTTEEVTELAEFLSQQRLCVLPPGASAILNEERKRGQKSLLSRLIHNYLFFRIPLFNPEGFLDWVLPLARVLASRVVVSLIVLLGLCGLYFAARQWDQFAKTFLDYFSVEGAMLYGVTLVGLKIFHELGHGLVARHYGVRVPVMGIAFMLLMPMMYTEVSDAWRLTSRRQRFLIGAAGVMVELALAAVALFLWAFLPDGPWRSAAYFVAVTAWIMSIVVNLSPFMRFDGYHMLADGTGLHNLGPRAFALTTWRLRQVLFATAEAPPEFFRPGLRRFLVTYALSTWLYRLSLFLGIAWLIYTTLPKAIGLPLAAIELMFFILLPIIRELKEWYAMGLRNLFSTRRSFISLGVLATLLVAIALPLDRHVAVPAILLPAKEASIYPPEPAQVAAVLMQPGRKVRKGDVLVRLVVPEIGQRQRLASLRLAVAEARLKRIAADKKDLAELRILTRERETLLEELAGLKARAGLLVVRSPQDGVLTGGLAQLKEGQWVGRNTLLAHVMGEEGAAMLGLVPEREVQRLSPDAAGWFVAEDGARSTFKGVLTDIGLPGGEGMALAYLSATAGGPIAMAAADNKTPQALTGQLPVRLAVEGDAPEKAVRGTAQVEAESRSLLGVAFGRVVTVFLRESGF